MTRVWPGLPLARRVSVSVTGVLLSRTRRPPVIAGGRLFFASEVRALLATGQLSDALDQSEGSMAAETARAFGLPHDVLWLEQKDALDAVLPWLDALDQPSMDGLNTFVISRRARGSRPLYRSAAVCRFVQSSRICCVPALISAP